MTCKDTGQARLNRGIGICTYNEPNGGAFDRARMSFPEGERWLNEELPMRHA